MNAVSGLSLTGRGSTKDAIEGMRLGAFAYLIKPLNIDELIKKMGEAIQGSEEKPPV